LSQGIPHSATPGQPTKSGEAKKQKSKNNKIKKKNSQ
jgi:hypothetical protein